MSGEYFDINWTPLLDVLNRIAEAQEASNEIAREVLARLTEDGDDE